MSEIKRAQLIPFATQKDNEKPLKETKKTIRISVVLPESNEHTCPEYNYKDELAAAKKRGKYKETNGANGLLRPNDLDDDDDDDVRRIAKQMEEKYGTGVSLNKKKRKGRKDDYADIGMGYDESDSFIDNTDGYDEMIPQNVTTLHGGFYINSGALEFKTDDEANSDFSSSSSSDEDDNENDDDDDDEDNNDDNDNNNEDSNKIKTTNRKRVIESSDETDRENKTDVDNLNQLQKKRKLQNGSNGMQQSIKKKLFNSNKIYVKKRRLVDQQKKTVKELLREKREDLNMSIPGSVNSNNVVNTDNNTDKENRPTITPTPPAIITTNGSVDNVIESVVKASTKDIEITRKSPINDNNNTINTVTTSSTSPIVTTKTIATPPPPSSPATIITPIKESSHVAHKVKVKLPENLPSDIVAIITTIQQLLIKYQNDIKNNDVNRMILRLERKSKCLGKPSKMKVYEYLANFANCKTDILIQRAKNLILDDEQKKLKTILSELKMEIDKIMPSLLENHEKESQRILQKKFSNDSIDSEEMKSLRMPKRRFIWNDITKKLVKDILMLKKRCLLLEGKHKETLDTLMLSFLRNDIQTLWPDGWMSMNALNKIYTTYADPKRLLNNALPTNSTTTLSQNDTNAITTSTTTVPTTTITTTTNIKPSLKNLPQSLSNNSNLSITPVIPTTKDNKNSSNNSSVDVRNSDTTMNLSRTLADKSHCDKVESRLKVKSPSELMMKPSNHHNNNNNSVKKLPDADITNDDSVIIIDRVSPIKDRTLHNNNNNSTNSNKADHNYQVIDLSDKNELKKSSDLINKHNLNKHHEISITPNFNSTIETTTTTTSTTTTTATTTTTKTVDTITKSSCGDDIQRVMEDLKALQKLSSSPKKCLIDNNMKPSSASSPTSTANSSAVSVIAVNKSFTPKTVLNHHHHHQQQQHHPHHHHHLHPHHQQQHHSTMQRIDYVKNSEFSGSTSSFQGEFQKQFLNVLNQLKPTTTTTTNKNNYNSIDTFPHIASGSGMVTNDKYYQTSSNYNQGPNGHKSTSTTTTTQSGTYNIIDDMFTSFLTQFGYPKEATTPKSQPK